MEFKGLQIKEDFPLKDFSTFKIGGPAKFYLAVSASKDLPLVFDFIKANNLDYFILGGGSNLLISDRGFAGLVINLNITGCEAVKSDGESSWLKFGSGEVWDEIVAGAVNQGLWGIENLSLIPGKTGGFVMQNVGAYGQEASQVVAGVEVFDTRDYQIKVMSNKDCQFAYRQSVFNSRARGRYIVLYITIKLAKHGLPNLDYADVRKYFQSGQIDKPDLKQIRQAIMAIRNSKFPPLDKVGNAGSFFKNVILEPETFKEFEQRVKKELGDRALSALGQVKRGSNGQVKIPTAFIIDKLLGLKGKQVGGAKIYDKQALVIINESGKAMAKDVMNLFKEVRQAVYKKTGLVLQPEPNLVGFSEKELEEYFRL